MRTKTVFNKKTKFTFGKHKGKTTEKVMCIEPHYIMWCIGNIEWFSLDSSLYDELEERLANTIDPYKPKVKVTSGYQSCGYYGGYSSRGYGNNQGDYDASDFAYGSMW